MRTTVELILELEHNAEGYEKAALIVGFENTTVFIEVDNPRRLELLNEAIKQGGEPVGWYRFRAGDLQLGPLQEYENEDWAHKYLETLFKVVRAGLKSLESGDN